MQWNKAVYTIMSFYDQTKFFKKLNGIKLFVVRNTFVHPRNLRMIIDFVCCDGKDTSLVGAMLYENNNGQLFITDDPYKLLEEHIYALNTFGVIFIPSGYYDKIKKNFKPLTNLIPNLNTAIADTKYLFLHTTATDPIVSYDDSSDRIKDYFSVIYDRARAITIPLKIHDREA